MNDIKFNLYMKLVRLRSMKLIHQLEKEINQAQYELDYHKVSFLKELIKKSKIYQRVLRFWSPFFLTFGLSFASFSYHGHTPFLSDYYAKEINLTCDDSITNQELEQFFLTNYKCFDDMISYVGKWEEFSSDSYIREIKTFDISTLHKEDFEQIHSILNFSSLEDVFGNPISYESEIKEKDMISNFEESEKIFIHEDSKFNIYSTLIWAVATLLLESSLWYLKFEEFDHDSNLETFILQTKQNYSVRAEEELTRILKINRDNFQRLTKGEK